MSQFCRARRRTRVGAGAAVRDAQNSKNALLHRDVPSARICIALTISCRICAYGRGQPLHACKVRALSIACCSEQNSEKIWQVWLAGSHVAGASSPRCPSADLPCAAPHEAMSSSSSSSKKRSTADAYEHLLSFGRTSYASKRAIASDMKRAREEGLPEHSSRGTQYRATEWKLGDDSNPFGPIVETFQLQCKPGKKADYSIQHPDGMLWTMAHDSPWFADCLLAALNENPCSSINPWRIVLYSRLWYSPAIVHPLYTWCDRSARTYEIILQDHSLRAPIRAGSSKSLAPSSH